MVQCPFQQRRLAGGCQRLAQLRIRTHAAARLGLHRHYANALAGRFVDRLPQYFVIGQRVVERNQHHVVDTQLHCRAQRQFRLMR